MCEAPKAPEVKINEPTYLTNPFDGDVRGAGATAEGLRIGRSALKIPLDTGLSVGFSGRSTVNGTTATRAPRGNGSPVRSNGLSVPQVPLSSSNSLRIR